MHKFESVEFDNASVEKVGAMREKAIDMERYAQKAVAESREKSLFVTHLETALMWFSKAVKEDQLKKKADIAKS